MGFARLHEVECGTGRIGSLFIPLSQRIDFTPQDWYGMYRIDAKPI